MKMKPEVIRHFHFYTRMAVLLLVIFVINGCGGGGSTGGDPYSPTIPQTSTITGRISNGSTPLSNAYVVLDTHQTTFTDNNGIFTFSDIPRGDRTLTVTYFLYEDYSTSFTVSEAEHIVPDISLTRITYPASSRQLSPDQYDAAPYQTHTETVLNANSDTFAINVPGTKLPRTMLITIENTGTTEIKNPKLLVNDRGDFTSMESILSEIIEPGMTDREKAIAIWWFVVNNRYHGKPPHPGFECHSPVKFLYVYGYGFCDTVSEIFCNLCLKAGIQARNYSVTNHVLSEAYYNGAWHMLDCDTESYYMKNDGEIASVAEAAATPALITAILHPVNPTAAYSERISELYASTADNAWYFTDYNPYKAELTLKPNERIEMFRENEDLFYYKQLYNYVMDPPDAGYSTAWLTYEPDTSGDLFLNYLDVRDNIASSPAGMTLEETGKGTAIFKVASPCVILKGILKASILAEAPESRIRISLSLDNKTSWIPLWENTAGVTGHQPIDIDFSKFFVTSQNDPYYTYYLKFDFASAAPLDKIGIKDLVLETHIQMASLAQPHLEPGNNDIKYSDESAAPSNASITYKYQPDCDDLVYRVDSTVPGNGDVNVDAADPIKAIFTEDVAGTDNAFHSMTVLVNSPAKSIKGTITYDAPSKTMTFTPDQPLEPNTKYRVFISRRCLLKKPPLNPSTTIGRKYLDYKWSFTTAP